MGVDSGKGSRNVPAKNLGEQKNKRRKEVVLIKSSFEKHIKKKKT